MKIIIKEKEVERIIRDALVDATLINIASSPELGKLYRDCLAEIKELFQAEKDT